MKCWARWSTSWNQDCWEKYQQPQICRWHHPYGRKWRGTKEPLDESERGEWKIWLKTQHSKMNIMASGPITSWQINGEMKQWQTLLSWIPKSLQTVTAAMKLLLWRKAMTSLDSVFKSRDLTLPTKFCLVKAMVFPVVMYGCECWTKEKAEHWRIDAFEL